MLTVEFWQPLASQGTKTKSGNMKKKVTIHDIAQELNITASTVSRALQDHPRISDSTKKAVIKVAKKLNYQPNQIAAALRSGKSKILGILVPNIDRSFFSSVVYGIEQIANKQGYNVMIVQSHDEYKKEVETVNALLNAKVDGIIASHAKETVDFSHFEKVLKNNIPLIFFDRANDDLGVSHVLLDDFMAAFKATEHLIRQGCSKIAHFTSYRKVSIYKERLRGYREALQAANIPVDENLIFTSDLELKDGQEIMHKIIDNKIEVHGIISASALGAMGALRVCKEKGLKIPEDIAIAGFSNEVFTEFTEPPITTVEQHSLDMGHTAANMFFEQLNDIVAQNNTKPKKMVLSPTLIVRKSTVRDQETDKFINF